MRILYYYVLYCSSNRNYLMRFTTYYNWREFPFKKNLTSVHCMLLLVILPVNTYLQLSK